MARKLEDYIPPIKEDGIITDKAAVLGSTLAVTGTSTLTGLVTATAGLTSAATLSINTATGNPAGDAVDMFMGSGNIGLYHGSGAPTISASKGSLYLRIDGSTTNDRLYINNGTTNWVAITTAS
jgi:hypothetical protein